VAARSTGPGVPLVGVGWYVNQRTDHLLHSIIKNETFKGLRIPLYAVKIINKQVG